MGLIKTTFTGQKIIYQWQLMMVKELLIVILWESHLTHTRRRRGRTT